MASDRLKAAPQGKQPERAKRLDASMSMINDLLQERIEDDYRAARKLRVGSPHAARPRLSVRVVRRTAFFALLVVCALLATSGVRQLAVDAPKSAVDHDALVQEARDRSANVAALERKLAKTRQQYGRAQRQALAKDTRGAQQVQQLKGLQDITGFNAVHGDGVLVVVDDARGDDLDDQDVGGRVLDRDLQLLVNGLWAAGAQAIAINGVRLTALTAIREAGDAVLVDYRPLARPYRVRAIGDPNSLQASFAEGPAGSYFKTLQTSFDMRFEMSDRRDMRLPAASSVTLQYARGKDNP
ncbi:MAG: DUF881 domain-containing protein [Streptosporangiales bacterium]|nr:DUF881 domain-containing protein [Streptosporangiales bacterium]